MLEVKNLVKRYQISKKSKTKTVTALNNVSIKFPETGLVFLLGKSGSGKSTLLNAIGGLDTFDEGEIIIKGKSSKEFSQADFDSYRNTFIGFIFQEYNVLEEFTVAKNLSLAIELQGKTATKENVDELLDMVEMKEFAKRKPNQLSGGQKQRVAIARALIKNPEIIMADEPTGALDSNTGKQVMETLKNLSKEKLVIIVSHDREFAEIYGDRIVELKDGKIIRDVTKKEVEPEKTSSGVSIIGDDVIHIKKGQKMTREDIDTIFKKIIENSEKSDTIISMSAEANHEVKKATSITDDGNREVFKETLEDDVKTKDYVGKDLKLIKSRLKFSDSFKMGASALKNKVGKLVFTIILSFVSFAMFGVIDTLSTFNRAQAVYSTIKEFNTKNVSLLKETKGDYRNQTDVFNGNDEQILKEKFPDIKVKKVVGKRINFGQGYYSNIYESMFSFVSSDIKTDAGADIKKPFSSGYLYMTETELSEAGIAIVAGRMPADKNEITISKYQYECIKALNTEKVTSYQSILDTYNEVYFSYYGGNSLKIVGITDDGKDMSEYLNISNQELNELRDKQEQMLRDIEFGFTNINFVSEEKYNKLLDDPVSVSVEIEYYPSENNRYTRQMNVNSISVDNYFEEYAKNAYSNADYFETYFYYKNGEIFNNYQFVDIADDEVIVPYNYLSCLNKTKDELKQLIQNNELFAYFYKDSPWDEENHANVPLITNTLKVVGFHDYYNSNVLMSSDKDGTYYDSYITFSPTGFGSVDNLVNTVYSISSFYKINNYVQEFDDWMNNYLGEVYLKDGQSFYDTTTNNYYQLKKDEVLLNAKYYNEIFGEFGDELKTAVDNGLTIRMLKTNGKEIKTYKVAGVYNTPYGWEGVYMNKEERDEVYIPMTRGCSYAIATLSNNEQQNKEFIMYCESFDDDGNKLTIQNGTTPILDQFGGIFEELTEIFLYVGLGFAVFASFLLMNFISTSISYKKREIGILRALGARSSDVFGVFFNESAIIAGINFVLATISTFVVSAVINNAVMNSLGLKLVILTVGIRQIILILGVSLLSALLASLLPVTKIARKKPIDAINNR